MWTSIITVLMKIIGMVLNGVGASIETKKRFFDFADSMEKGNITSSALRKDYASNKEKNSAMIKAIEEKEGVKK